MLKALVLLLSWGLPAHGLTSHWTGQPGQPWTEEEMLAVKAKIVQIFLKNKVVYKEYLKLHPEKKKPDWQVMLPNAAKILRLGFHDCLTTEAGGGGCNGCLNPTGMRTNVEPSGKEVSWELKISNLTFHSGCHLNQTGSPTTMGLDRQQISSKRFIQTESFQARLLS